jgi:hypothetical protein
MPECRHNANWVNDLRSKCEPLDTRPSGSYIQVMPIEFTATQMGFKDGLGGASNSKSPAPYHYILFGKRVDPQHSWNSGLYFEFDSQRKGGVNRVKKVLLAQSEPVLLWGTWRPFWLGARRTRMGGKDSWRVFMRFLDSSWTRRHNHRRQRTPRLRFVCISRPWPSPLLRTVGQFVANLHDRAFGEVH